MSQCFYIQTDASYYGIGATLFQLTMSDGERGVIAYTSRVLQNAELRYTVTEKELLSVVYALQQWRVFVLGRHVTVLCDHKVLSFLKSCPLLNARLARWSMCIQEYDVTIQYCKGSENIIADTLSRAPLGRGEFGPELSEIHIATIQEFDKRMGKLLKDIEKYQKEDEFCVKITDKLNKETVRDKEKWFVSHQGRLFKRGSTKCPGYKLVVPKKLIISIVKVEHEENGHFGARKCYERLKRYFFPKNGEKYSKNSGRLSGMPEIKGNTLFGRTNGECPCK